MERLIAVEGDERCVEFGPSVEISTEKTTRVYEGLCGISAYSVIDFVKCLFHIKLLLFFSINLRVLLKALVISKLIVLYSILLGLFNSLGVGIF